MFISSGIDSSSQATRVEAQDDLKYIRLRTAPAQKFN